MDVSRTNSDTSGGWGNAQLTPIGLRTEVPEKFEKINGRALHELAALVDELRVLLETFSPPLLKSSSADAHQPLRSAAVNPKTLSNLQYNNYSEYPLLKSDKGDMGFIAGGPDAAGVKPTDIFTDFTQGGQGHCAAVAAIKAAMMRFGHSPYGIYKNIEAVADGFNIVMRDGFSLHVTHGEIRHATTIADFRCGSPNDVLTNANFLFAVTAKRMQKERLFFDSFTTFEECVGSLNSGAHPGDILRRMGLGTRIVGASMKDLRNGAIGTLWTLGHVGVVAGGYLDHYGKVKLTDTNRGIAGNIGIKLI
ncbi:hypothetical protein [Pseudomonas sp. SDO5271_S396]